MPEPQPLELPAEVKALNPWLLKTNLIGWALGVSNVALEFDFSDHFSMAFPIYYSGINYFTTNLKFRTLTFQPELRYWFKSRRSLGGRWFVGAHYGMGWFNYSLNGEYRYQSHYNSHPAYGGGIACGYRISLPWIHQGLFKLEFTLGVGAYRATYDVWQNIKNGALVSSSNRTTFIGIDQAAVSLIFHFGTDY